MSFDFSKTFLDGKLALNFYVEDIFGSMKSDLKIYDGGQALIQHGAEILLYFFPSRTYMAFRPGSELQTQSRQLG